MRLVLRGNLAAVLVAGLMLSALPQMVLLYSTAAIAGPLASRGVDLQRLAGWVSIASFAVDLLAGTVLQGAVIDRLAAREDGDRSGWGASLGVGCRLFLPNLAIGLLTWLGFALGGLLLVAPGVMLLCRWSVSTVAEVVERTGVRDAFGRSRDLTSGHRWRVFGVLAICFAALAPAGAAQALLERAMAGWGPAVLVTPAVSALVTMTFDLVFTIAGVGLYLELRRVKEGGRLSEIEAVFT